MSPEAGVSRCFCGYNSRLPVLESPSQAVFARGPHWVFREQEDMEFRDTKRLLEGYHCGRQRSSGPSSRDEIEAVNMRRDGTLLHQIGRVCLSEWRFFMTDWKETQVVICHDLEIPQR